LENLLHSISGREIESLWNKNKITSSGLSFLTRLVVENELAAAQYFGVLLRRKRYYSTMYFVRPLHFHAVSLWFGRFVTVHVKGGKVKGDTTVLGFVPVVVGTVKPSDNIKHYYCDGWENLFQG
jgi:hypothetical protein